MSSFTNTQINKSIDDISIKVGDKVKITAAPSEMNIIGKTGVVIEIYENFRDGFRNYIISSEIEELNGEFSLAWDVKVEKIVETDKLKDSVKVEEKQSIDVLGIGLDTSGSMAGILSTVVNEGMGVVDALNPEQVVFCEFSSHFECYTLDKEKSKERMNQVTANGGTAMYDGVTTMLKELVKLSLQGKKVMALIITDGLENSSVKFTKENLEETKIKLRELAGNDCIREICIGSNLVEANRLMQLTPGLNRQTSAPVTRDLRSISKAIRSMSNQSAPVTSNFEIKNSQTVDFPFPKLERM